MVFSGVEAVPGSVPVMCRARKRWCNVPFRRLRIQVPYVPRRASTTEARWTEGEVVARRPGPGAMVETRITGFFLGSRWVGMKGECSESFDCFADGLFWSFGGN